MLFSVRIIIVPSLYRYLHLKKLLNLFFCSSFAPGRAACAVGFHDDPGSCTRSCLPCAGTIKKKNFDTILDFCVSSLRRGHANLLCIVPILTDDLRRGSRLSKPSWVYIFVIFFWTAVASLCLFRDFVGLLALVRGGI